MTEHFDVLIVGAGLSGIGAAYRLQTECPGRTYAILESRSASGGTWDLFRYPGVRSDSDMLTLGYPFRPWTHSQTIAEGPDILRYLRETASEYGIDRMIRYGQRVVAATWDRESARWTVTVMREEAEDAPAGGIVYTCRFLYLCTGYYSYDGGYRPEFPGLGRFRGEVVHPQAWPEDLDYAGKQVVVIGSGATAMTLVPAMAGTAAHVTMVQRSPTYVISLPRIDPIAAGLVKALPPAWGRRLARWKNVVMTQAFYLLCRRRPRAARRLLRAGAERQLPEGYPVDPDFTPTYDPWDQRMCIVPDGDLFESISAGTSSVVTGQVEAFTEAGIRMSSGEELDVDLVVLATGLRLVPWGGITLNVDGAEVDPGSTFVYQGCLLSDVPNLAFCVGYVNASWTLRADLSSRYVCRLLNYMAEHGYDAAVPRYSEAPGSGGPVFNLSSGYVARTAALLPKQGRRGPWRFRHNYPLDFFLSQTADLTTEMEFSRATEPRPAPAPVASLTG
jgi:cation diffusion facilitator CzcD-associated flavoprotein CzcO